MKEFIRDNRWALILWGILIVSALFFSLEVYINDGEIDLAFPAFMIVIAGASIVPKFIAQALKPEYPSWVLPFRIIYTALLIASLFYRYYFPGKNGFNWFTFGVFAFLTLWAFIYLWGIRKQPKPGEYRWW